MRVFFRLLKDPNNLRDRDGGVCGRLTDLTIDKRKTCLVVIDLQKGILSMPTEPYDVRTVVSNAVKLATAFRENEMSVFLVHVALSRETALQPVADLVMPSRGEVPADWANIVPELGPAPSDVVIVKRQWGAFYGTDLDLRLRPGDWTRLCLQASLQLMELRALQGSRMSMAISKSLLRMRCQTVPRKHITVPSNSF